jgi:ferritin
MSSEAIIIAVALVVIGLLTASNLILRIKNKTLIVKSSQADLDRLSVYVKSQELLSKAAEENRGQDGFVKFMATSRDWAFEYIEAVQKDLYDLKDVFGATKGTAKTVAQANALSEAVRKVLEHLPEGDK